MKYTPILGGLFLAIPEGCMPLTARLRALPQCIA
jgi:hypothetical protein